MASVGLADTGFRYVWFAPRAVAGKNAAWIPGNTHTWLEVWFKLTREGDIFTAYQSLDGQTWYKVGSQAVDMADDYYAGMYVASGTSMQASFDHLTLTDELHPALPQVKGLKAEALNSTGGACRLLCGTPCRFHRRGVGNCGRFLSGYRFCG